MVCEWDVFEHRWLLLFVYSFIDTGVSPSLVVSIYESVHRLQFHSSIARINGELEAKLCTWINLIHLRL